jgi:hypothetical protein
MFIVLRTVSANLPEGTTYGSPMLCAVRGIGETLDFAMEIAKDMNRPLYVMFVREQAIHPGRSEANLEKRREGTRDLCLLEGEG